MVEMSSAQLSPIQTECKHTQIPAEWLRVWWTGVPLVNLADERARGRAVNEWMIRLTPLYFWSLHSPSDVYCGWTNHRGFQFVPLRSSSRFPPQMKASDLNKLIRRGGWSPRWTCRMDRKEQRSPESRRLILMDIRPGAKKIKYE